MQRAKEKTLAGRKFAVVFICSVIIALLAGKAIPYATGVSALNDTFGYWGVAATLAGKDWSPLLSLVEFYSGGYSLLLVPLFWLNLSAQQMYQLALVLNVLLLLGSYYLAISCINTLFPNLSWGKKYIIPFITCIYTSNLLQAQEAWAETFLYFLYWLLVYALIKFIEKGTVLKAAFVAAIAGYIYTVHLRTVGILIAIVLTFVFAVIGKAIKRRHLISFLLTLILGFLAQNLYKSWILSNVFVTPDVAEQNTYASQTTKIFSIFSSWENIEGFLRGCIGKCFYFVTSTLYLGPIAIVFLAFCVFKAVQQLIYKSTHKVDKGLIVPFFLLFSSLGCFGIMCLSINNIYGRLDLAIYSRYAENCFGPLIAIGLALLVQGNVLPKECIIMVALAGGMAVVTNDSLVLSNRAGANSFNWPCAPVLQKLYETYKSVPGFALFVWIVCSVLFVIMWYFSSKRRRKAEATTKEENRLRKRQKCIAVAIPLVFWIWSSFSHSVFIEYQTTVGNQNQPVLDLFSEVQDTPDDIYFILTDSDIENFEDTTIKYSGAKFLQARLPDTTVQVISKTEYVEMDSDDDTVYLAISNEGRELVEINNVQLYSCGRYALYSSPTSKYATQATSAHEVDLTTYKKEENVQVITEGKDTTLLISPADEGKYAIYGPYLDLSAGQYRATFTLELLNPDDSPEELGTCDVSTGGNILVEQKLRKSDFVNQGSQQVTLDFGTGMNRLTGVEFRLYVEPGVQFRVTDISYQCTGLERQAILPGTEDYSMLLSVLGYDTESLPLQIAVDDAMLPYVSCSQLQEELGRAHEVSLVGISEMVVPETPTILLVPADETELLFDLLPRDTVLVRLNEYAVVVPSGYSIERNFVEAGGRTLSDGDRLNVRYFQGTGKSNYGSINATIPAGEYDLSYRVDVLGTPLWGDLGTLSIRGGGINVSESLSPDMFTYGVYEGSRALTMEDSGQLSMQLTTRSGITVTRMEAYLSRRG